MGWDAYAFHPDHEMLLEKNWDNNKLIDPTMNKHFQDACSIVREHAPNHDPMLPLAGLDYSRCGFILTYATNQPCMCNIEWNPKKVKKVAAAANWNFDLNDFQNKYGRSHYDTKYFEIFYWSTRIFLQTCAKLNLGIGFSC